MRVSPFACGPTRMFSSGRVAPAVPLPYNPQHFGLIKGWASTDGHLSGPGGTYDTLKVTNLNASGAGSLRAALEASGARLVVFEVSGNIDLAQGTIDIDDPYITVAGQTAPAPGITIINGTVRPRSTDFILMHLKFRPGTGAGSTKDAMETRPGAKHGVISHCSFSWGTDGTLDIAGFNLSGSDPAVWRDITSRNITVDRCIIAETLTVGSGATLVEDNANAILFYGCMFSNSPHRMPLWKGGSRGAMINCLLYNGADKFTDSTLEADAWSGKTKQEAWFDALGNYAKGGPDTYAPAFFEVVSNYGAKYFGADNIVLDSSGDPLPETLCIADTEPYNTGGYITIESSEIQGGHGVSPISAAASTPDFVEASAGAFPWDRDAIDARQFTTFRAGTGQHIATQETVGGYPESVHTVRVFDPAAWNVASSAVVPISEAAFDPGEPVIEYVARFDFTDLGSLSTNANGTGSVSSVGNRVGRVTDPVSGHYIAAEDTDNRWVIVDDGARLTVRSGPWRQLTDTADGGWLDGLLNNQDPWWIVACVKRVSFEHNFSSRIIEKEHGDGGTVMQIKGGAGDTEVLALERTPNEASTPISSWASPRVLSAGYTGSSITTRIDLGTKATQATAGVLSDSPSTVYFGAGIDELDWYALAVLDHYPDSEEEEAAIRQVAAIAGLTL